MIAESLFTAIFPPINMGVNMVDHVAVAESPTPEILGLCQTKVPDYISRKRRGAELGGIIAKLNHELMFGDAGTRDKAGEALTKLGYVLD